ncbi:hypothetical protein NDU88_006917 [Pleurodeles waltl]|uniref:Uncharacterized protein n=1 Tax=Pleurodeles waltl TaxID=8319 RepID=A0AAV7N0T0_PLEWA|nr:hypothetical protein NDU88_006917 [Pleurodeles waltl]
MNLNPTPDVCLLGYGDDLPRGRVEIRFLNLALVMYRRQIAKSWKAQFRPPPRVRWRQDVTTWARADLQVLKSEEGKGLRRYPIAQEWEMAVTSWSNIVRATDANTDATAGGELGK